MYTSLHAVYRPWVLLCIACVVCIIPGCRVVVGEDCVDIIGIEGQIFNTCRDSVPPAPITNHEIVAADTTITITWTPSISNDVAEIHITWSSEHDPEKQPKIMNGTSITATITALQPYTEYTVRIKTIDTSKNVSPTTEITATTAASLLFTDTPSFSSTETPGSTVGQVSATVVPPNTAITIASYEIIANTDDDSALFAIDTQTGEITVGESMLDPHASYSFTVRATSTQGISTTTIVTVAPHDTTAPAPITALHADTVAGTSDILLTWTDSPSTDVRHVHITWHHQDGSGSIGGPILVPQGTQSATINDLDSEQEYTFTLVAEDGTHTSAAQIVTITTGDTTAPDSVTMLTGAAQRDGSSIEIGWNGSRSTDVMSVTVTWRLSATRSITGTAHASSSSGSVVHTITDLMPYRFYHISVIVTDTAGNARTRALSIRTAPNPIDSDGDSLIDINTLDALHNIRYNLAGSSYKESSSDSGILCGRSADTICIGYELDQDLDFTDVTSYSNGIVNAAWRPQDGSGTVLLQHNTDNATNAGWPPIGRCRTDTTGVCDNDAPFATLFVGNGFTISNLYARNTDNNNPAAIGLFGIIDSSATIHDLGIANAAAYDSSVAGGHVGALAGDNHGTITSSYVHNSTTNGGGGSFDDIGGLVGQNTGSIIASYAHSSTVNGGEDGFDDTGGLVGQNNGNIIASYVINGTLNGGEGSSDHVGGLVGMNIGTIIASYTHSSTVNDGQGTSDRVGGLVGQSSGTIIASYADGIADGGTDSYDIVGGLVGHNANNNASVIASYATATADGGTGTGDRVSSLVGVNSETLIGITPPTTTDGTITASYGFGTIVNADRTGTDDSGDRPSAVGSSGSGIAGARQLTAPGADATTAVASQWNDDDQNTQDAWHFGTTGQAPALQYADYDGAGTEYGCGTTTGTIATIPSVVPDGMGDTITIVCGTTLLPGQER